MDPWQSTLENFSNIMPYLLDTGTFSDFTFVVGEGSNKKSFKVHKLLLAIRSDVFGRMFFGSLPEGGEIEVPDVSPDTFEIMLKFIYEDKLVAESIEKILDTFSLAHRYNITQLMHLCRNSLKYQLNPENASLVYQVSIMYNDQKLKYISSQIISRHPEEVVQSETFTKIAAETVESIVEMKPFNETKQFLFFGSLIKWAKAELERRHDDASVQNLRKLLNPFLPKIQFLSMSAEEFTRGPAASGILTESDIAKTLMNIAVLNSDPVPNSSNSEVDLAAKDSFMLLLLRRSSTTHKTLHHICFHTTNYYSVFKGEIQCNIQVIEKSVILKGFNIYGHHSSHNPKLSIQINNQEKEIQMNDLKTTRLINSINTPLPVMTLMLKEPIIMKGYATYNIKLNVNVSTCCGKNDRISEELFSTDKISFVVNYIPNKSTGVKSLHFYEILYCELDY